MKDINHANSQTADLLQRQLKMHNQQQQVDNIDNKHFCAIKTMIP